MTIIAIKIAIGIIKCSNASSKSPFLFNFDFFIFSLLVFFGLLLNFNYFKFAIKMLSFGVGFFALFAFSFFASFLPFISLVAYLHYNSYIPVICRYRKRRSRFLLVRSLAFMLNFNHSVIWGGWRI